MGAKKKKRHLRKSVKFGLVIILVGILGFISYDVLFDNGTVIDKFNPRRVTYGGKDKVEDPIKVYTAKLIGTGDGLMHPAVYKSVYNANTDSYDFSNILKDIKEEIKDYDIKYYNQETVFGVSDEGNQSPTHYGGYPRFNSPSAYGSAMIDAGFNLVSLATNHSYDMGKTGAINSINWWNKQREKEVYSTGMALTEEDRKNYVIFEKNNIKFGFLSYTTETNGLFNESVGPLVNYYTDTKAKEDIDAIKDKVDVIIVAMHWGTEYSLQPIAKQKEIASTLSSYGVNIILGTHSHCVEPIEKVGDTIVFYSFGNFLSNQGDLYNTIGNKGVVGLLGGLTITKTVDTEKDTTTVEIGDVTAELLYVYNSNHRNYKVIPFSKMSSNYLSNYKDVYEQYKKVITSMDTDGSLVSVKPVKQ